MSTPLDDRALIDALRPLVQEYHRRFPSLHPVDLLTGLLADPHGLHLAHEACERRVRTLLHRDPPVD
jgi:hypothetical protein